MEKSKTRCIGLLTSGGDCPGLNAVIRAIAKAAITHYGIRVIGVQDGFRGLVENRTIALDESAVSGILTRGGTILGASRDKPHSMPMGGKFRFPDPGGNYFGDRHGFPLVAGRVKVMVRAVPG